MVPVAAVDHATAVWNSRVRHCKGHGTYACRNQDDPDVVLDGHQH
jgi:hypothetical protein